MGNTFSNFVYINIVYFFFEILRSIYSKYLIFYYTNVLKCRSIKLSYLEKIFSDSTNIIC